MQQQNRWCFSNCQLLKKKLVVQKKQQSQQFKATLKRKRLIIQKQIEIEDKNDQIIELVEHIRQKQQEAKNEDKGLVP